MAEKTAEEVRLELVDRMGERLGPVFYLLLRETAGIHVRWSEFKQLFAEASNIETMNATAPIFFGRLQGTLFSEVVLQLCRLTDSPRSAGRTNLTIRSLPPLVGDERLREEIQDLVDTAVKSSEFARARRHKQLAHLDLESALKPDLNPLPPATRTLVDGALRALRAVLNRVELTYTGSPIAYEDSIPARQGAAALLYFVRAGRESERIRRPRLEDQLPGTS